MRAIRVGYQSINGADEHAPDDRCRKKPDGNPKRDENWSGSEPDSGCEPCVDRACGSVWNRIAPCRVYLEYCRKNGEQRGAVVVPSRPVVKRASGSNRMRMAGAKEAADRHPV